MCCPKVDVLLIGTCWHDRLYVKSQAELYRVSSALTAGHGCYKKRKEEILGSTLGISNTFASCNASDCWGQWTAKNISLTAEMNAAHCSDVYSSQNECETTLVPKVIAPEHDPGMHITPYAGQLS